MNLSKRSLLVSTAALMVGSKVNAAPGPIRVSLGPPVRLSISAPAGSYSWGDSDIHISSWSNGGRL